jgi:hypothetical protein
MLSRGLLRGGPLSPFGKYLLTFSSGLIFKKHYNVSEASLNGQRRKKAKKKN